MPVITDFLDQPLQTPGPPQIPTLDVSRAGAAAEAMARGQAGVSDEFAALAQHMAEARRAVAVSDTMVQTQQRLDDLAQKHAKLAGTKDANGSIINADQAVSGFVDEAQQLRAGLVTGIRDPRVQAMVAQHFDEAQISHARDVRTAGFLRESAAGVGQLDLDLNDLSHRMAQAQTPEGRAQVYDTAATAIATKEQAGYLSPETAATKLIQFRARADYAQAQRDLDVNPALALKKLNDPAQYFNLDELTRSRLIMRAENKVMVGEAQARGQVTSAIDDNLASIARTGEPAVPLTNGQIRAAFAKQPETAQRFIDAMGRARDTWRATQSVALTSPEDDAALIRRFEPAGANYALQERAQSEVVDAVKRKYTALAQDPAAYVLKASPEIGAQFTVSQKDPSELGPAIGALDAAYDKLGVPPESRAVLPAATARDMAAKIAADPEHAPERLHELEQQFGIHWPRAWSDITSLGKLPAAYQAVPVLENERDGSLLARWLAEVPKGKTAADLLGAKPENDIKASVRSDPGVQSLLQSLSRSGSSAGQVDGVLQSIDALAFAKSYYDRDPKAAQSAIDSFVSKYEFMPNGGARVPKASFDAVSANARALLQSLDAERVAVPPIFGQPTMPTPEEYLGLLKSAPTWITAPGADALWLMDAYGRLVRGRDRQPLEVRFDAPPPAPAAPGNDFSGVQP